MVQSQPPGLPCHAATAVMKAFVKHGIAYDVVVDCEPSDDE